jgi:hypothetical protein
VQGKTKILKLIFSAVVAILLSMEMSTSVFAHHFTTYIFNDTTQPRKPGPDSIKIIVHNKDKDSFYVALKDSLSIEKPVYESVSKIIAISDIEGNFNGLYSFLIANKVMDKNYNWIFGNGHVVFLGDFVDRGAASVEVLWLIYKLDDEAAKEGGKVHFILGNHEAINIQGVGFSEKRKAGNDEYVTDVPFDKTNRVFFSANATLGKWLRTKNTIEKIGDYLFVHAGISPKILAFKADIQEINNTIRENIEHDLYHDPGKNKFANLLIGREGPLWFRGMAMNYKYYNKVTASEFSQIQIYFGSPKIVIGHTPFTEIGTDFNGSLIRIDTPHSEEKFSGGTMGLLIQDGVEFKIDDKGRKTRL